MLCIVKSHMPCFCFENDRRMRRFSTASRQFGQPEDSNPAQRNADYQGTRRPAQIGPGTMARPDKIPFSCALVCHIRVRHRLKTGLLRLVVLQSFLHPGVPMPVTVQEAGSVPSPQVKVESDDRMHTMTYTAASDSCRISWVLFETELNRAVIRHYADCRQSWEIQAPLISRVAEKIFENPTNRNTLHTLTWGRLTPDGATEVRMAVRLAAAAIRSPNWDRSSGRSRTVHINRLVRDLANEACIYAELKNVLSPMGVALSVSSIEKVLVSKAGSLPFFAELKKQGIDIDYPVEIPIVTYFGDTQYVDFSQLPYIAESKILIAECTFYEGEHATRAEAGRHMHIDEFVTLLTKLNNEHIIVTHTTQRTPMREIQKILKNALPKDKYDRITLLMDRRY